MTRIVLDHISLSVGDMARARAFYEKALAPIGFTVLMEFPASMTGTVDVAGLGVEGKPYFWLSASGRQTPATHIAFGVETRAEVDAFYEASITAGGTDNGAPGIREIYHPTYYGAFVRDPEGHNIEAVCHAPE